MKSIIKKLAMCLMLGAPMGAHAAFVPFPDGDFTSGQGTWSAEGPITSFSYPSSGGNPGGYGVMNASNGEWGVWVSSNNNGDFLPFSSLGLTAGQTYNFKMDMKLEDGSTGNASGGIKIEWTGGGDSGDKRTSTPPVTINTTWQTFTFPITIPAGKTGLKVVPLWGPNSIVGYDNIGVDNTPVGAPPAPTTIPNGGFETPGGATWAQVFGGGTTTYTYPTSGGNPGGYGNMNNVGGWGIWVANSDAVLAIGPLGLIAGNTYNFKQDMKIFSGTNIGGFKVDFFPSGSSGDVYKPKIGTGATWETYTFPVTLPPGTTGIKVVPLWGPNSSVGYDNITVNTTPVVPVPDQIPNGDFEVAGGASWGPKPQSTVTFPASGGNPGGNAVLDGTNPSVFAELFAFNEAEKTFSSLGLSPGQIFKIQLDMRITNGGSTIGGIRLVGPAGYVAEAFPALIGDGSTWETYTVQFTVPASPAQTKIGIRTNFPADSIVAFDNVTIVLPTAAPAPQPSILIGKTVSWTPTVADSFYQPQESVDNSVWTNLGSSFTGTTVASIFDPTPAPFYRVQESAPVITEAVINGGFEDLFFDEPDGWGLFQSQPPTLSTDVRPGSTGTNSVKIKVQNDAVGASPNGSEIQQNIGNAGGSITAGNSYNFSFWAKQISVGPSYVQQYRVQWLDGVGAEVGGAVAFQNFSGTIGAWEQQTKNNLLAPTGATTALIQILGVTGAVDGGFGEVIIDDVSLQSTAPGAPATIAASSVSTAEISWQSVAGQSYQLRSSTDLSGWSPFGGVIAGNNTIMKAYDTPLLTKKFYQLGTLP